MSASVALPLSIPFARVSVGRLGIVLFIKFRIIENGSVKRTTVGMDTTAAVAELIDIASSYASTGVVPVDELDEVQYFWFTSWSDRVYKVSIRDSDPKEEKNTADNDTSLVKDDADGQLAENGEGEQIILQPLDSGVQSSNHANRGAVESMMALMRGTSEEVQATDKPTPIASQPYVSNIFLLPIVDIWTAEVFSQGVMSRRCGGISYIVCLAPPCVHVDSYRYTTVKI